jgi:hypothetical protein
MTPSNILYKQLKFGRSIRLNCILISSEHLEENYGCRRRIKFLLRKGIKEGYSLKKSFRHGGSVKAYDMNRTLYFGY